MAGGLELRDWAHFHFWPWLKSSSVKVRDKIGLVRQGRAFIEPQSGKQCCYIVSSKRLEKTSLGGDQLCDECALALLQLKNLFLD
jgi:hypothetical protein